MYKGGCYPAGSGTGGKICKTAAVGVCTAAVETKEYTTIPEADRDPTKQSVISCGSIEEVTVKDGKKYKGVAHCTKCQEPAKNNGDAAVAATCETCEDKFFGNTCTACHESCKTCSAEGENGCTSCPTDTHFLGATGLGPGKCVPCGTVQATWSGVKDCAKCTQPNAKNTPAVCTECAADFYLKPAAGAGAAAPSCVAASECGEGFFPTTVSDVKKCVACSTKDNGGIENCAKCSLKATSTKAGPIVMCSECTTNNLSPLKDECMAACPAGTYANNKVCTPCHSSCASCQTDDKETSCTACYPGHSLLYEANGATGRCVKECTGTFGANCADGQCTADVGGAKYCAQCKDGYAPIDGICTAVKTGRDASVCTAASGKCTACTGDYALISGGCYGTQKLPGKSVCTQASAGQCQTCANKQNPAQGSCPACSEGCAECQANTATCTKCYSGYYKTVDNKCVKCTASSENGGNAITGVENCMSCAPPTSPPGPVTCYVKTDGTNNGGNDNNGGSTNKSGLSTGAIAGISVAVVVVVGGLVGFLCWWFICRGKA